MSHSPSDLPYTTPFQLVVASFLNLGAWLATVASWGAARELVSLIATLAAISVSVASLVWIRKQSRAFDEERKFRRAHSKVPFIADGGVGE